MNYKKIQEELAIGLETIGVVAIVAGIALEVMFSADVVFIVITGASALTATGALIWVKILKK